MSALTRSPRALPVAPCLRHCRSWSSTTARTSTATVHLPQPPQLPRRRVVVTGLGLVTPLGVGVDVAWKRIIDGHVGTSSISEHGPEFAAQFARHELPSTVIARVPRGKDPGAFDPKQWLQPGDEKKMPTFVQFAAAAATQALADARWSPRDTPGASVRTGVAIGSGMVGLEDIIDAAETLATKGTRRISPFFVPRILVNMAAGHVSIAHGLQGPNHAASTACATGAHAIGDAFRMVRDGDADVMVAGGSESCIHPLAITGFSRAKALSTQFNDRPHEASRPFDSARDGFVIGEGAGVVVLEEYRHALARGAPIYAEIRGYGLSGDAHHITAPSEDGRGALQCMRAALESAGLAPESVDYVNAHATSTPLGDAIENRAIKALFGAHAKRLCVSSTKGATGHLLGAAGAVEAIFAILAVAQNVVPPTANLHNRTEEFDLDYVPLAAQRRKVDVAMTNSFGFGGTNACLCVAKPSPP